MPTVNVNNESGVALFEPAQGNVLVVNNDEDYTLWVSPNRKVSLTDIPIAPQASLVLDGAIRWYASTVTAIPFADRAGGQIQALVIPGGLQWDNPVGVEVALSNLGLATAELQSTQMSVGIPPNVPSLLGVNHNFGNPEGSPYTLVTMPSDGRLWAVTLSVAACTNSSFSGGSSELYGAVFAGSVTLEIIELCVSEGSQAVNDHGDLDLYGLPISEGTAITLDVNGGTELSDSIIRASCSVLYSIP